MENRKLLVTGGAGFIGANFVHYWVNQHPTDTLVVLDELTYAGVIASIQPLIDTGRIIFVKGNICDQQLIEKLLRDHQLNTVVHFAAESHVDRSITGPDAFIETNIIGTHSLLKAARQCWLVEKTAPEHRFHHVSTDEVFGELGPEDPAFSETTPYSPNSPYSASKAASDHLVQAYGETYGLKWTMSNCSNNYGPYHFPEKLIPLMITNALQGKPLPIYGEGKNIRDWLYVEDHCRGIELILNQERTTRSWNIGGINEWTNIDIVNAICDTLEKAFTEDPNLSREWPKCPTANGKSINSLITYVEDRSGHDWRYAIDPERIQSELGYTPSLQFADGLQKTINWYLEHKIWWQPLLTA